LISIGKNEEVGKYQVQTPFPELYKPTWQEVFDKVARKASPPGNTTTKPQGLLVVKGHRRNIALRD